MKRTLILVIFETGSNFIEGALRVVVDDLAIGLVIAGSQVLLYEGQTDSIGNSLAKRTCTVNEQLYSIIMLQQQIITNKS